MPSGLSRLSGQVKRCRFGDYFTAEFWGCVSLEITSTEGRSKEMKVN